MKELSREQLLDIAKSPKAAVRCSECSSLSCPGWISKPGYFDLSKLRIVGTLRIEGAQESNIIPTIDQTFLSVAVARKSFCTTPNMAATTSMSASGS